MIPISNKNKTFLLISETLANINLIKEVGMIPYYFHRNFNFNSTILTYKNEKSYPYLEKFCDGLNLEFLKKKKEFNIRSHGERPVISYLLRNSRKIDILEVIHLTNRSILYGLIYKFLNRNGFLYLKLDAWDDIEMHNKLNPFGYSNYNFYKKESTFKSIKNHIRVLIGKKVSKIFFKKLGIMSIESKEIYNSIKNFPKIKKKLIYLPSGIDKNQLTKYNINRLEYKEKKNIILTVGLIGWDPKDHGTLLRAIPKIKDLKDWKVLFVGKIESLFKKEINTFYKKHPLLKENVVFTGFVSRKKLLEYYQKSKIFCLTSKNESFGIVLVEAGYFGNYIVSTNIPSARDITKSGKLGKLYKVKDSEELALILENLIKNEEILVSNYLKIQNYIEKNFLWNDIVSHLYREIVKRKRIKPSTT